jgi:hypothetical protein
MGGLWQLCLITLFWLAAVGSAIAATGFETSSGTCSVVDELRPVWLDKDAGTQAFRGWMHQFGIWFAHSSLRLNLLFLIYPCISDGLKREMPSTFVRFRLTPKANFATVNGTPCLVAVDDILANDTVFRVPREKALRTGADAWRCPFPAFVDAVFWSKAKV